MAKLAAYHSTAFAATKGLSSKGFKVRKIGLPTYLDSHFMWPSKVS